MSPTKNSPRKGKTTAKKALLKLPPQASKKNTSNVTVSRKLCGRCDVHPKVLRSQCQHTKAGRAFLASQVDEPAPFILPATTDSGSVEQPDGGPQMASPITPAANAASLGLAEQEIIQQIVNEPQLVDEPQLELLAAGSLLPILPVTVPANPQTPASRRVVASAFSSSPALSAFATPNAQQLSIQVGSSEASSPAVQAATTDTESTPKQGTVLKPTKKNSFYGVVRGAYRGENEYQFPREFVPRPVQKIQTKATARFRSEVLKIITRAEMLAIETGCWIFFTAQHVQADGAFWHYASPRLVRDAHEELNSVISIFHKTFQILLAAGAKQKKDHQIEIYDLKQQLLEKDREIERMRISVETGDRLAEET